MLPQALASDLHVAVAVAVAVASQSHLATSPPLLPGCQAARLLHWLLHWLLLTLAAAHPTTLAAAHPCCCSPYYHGCCSK